MRILILVMSHVTEDMNFISYKETWDKIIEEIKVNNLPIDVFFLYSDNNISKEYIIEGNNLISKCDENYWYSLLVKVLNGFDFSIENKYDLTFKTNLSTLVNLKEFYNFCLKSKDRTLVYDGVVGSYQDYKFCSGAGILLSSDSIKIVLENRNNATTEWTDDIFIGNVLNKKNNIIPNLGQMTRYDIVNFQNNLDEEKILKSTHIRIKIRELNYDSIMTKKVYDILHEKNNII